MATRKKGKKSKWQAMPLTDLIPETPGGMPAMPKVTSWTDDVDDDHEYTYSSRKPQEPVVLPTAPRAARDPGLNEENIPMNPPFVAYISNLPYDVLEEDLANFFADMQVTNMRLPKDSVKLRGYGYVDFEDRQSLIDALSMTNMTVKGRRVRIEVSNSNSDRGRMNMGRDYGRRENYDDADRNSTDWRSGPRDEPTSTDGDRFRSRGGGFDKGDRREDRESSASDNRPGAWREARAALPDLPDRSERGGSSFGDRRGNFRSDDKDREYSRFGDRGRDYESSDRGGERGGSSSFGQRRNYGERDRDRESDWGNRLSTRPATSEEPSAAAAAPAGGEARTRVKLNLQPRTKPVENPVVKEDGQEEQEPSENDETSAPPAPAAAPAAPVNIFGAAKPVDTTAREREIEERLARTYADSKPKGEEGERKGPPKEGMWGRRNGEGRNDNEKEKPRATWRSDEDRGRQVDRTSSRNPGAGRSEARPDSRGPPSSRSGPSGSRSGQRSSETRGPPERERKDRGKEDDAPPMPKATDEQAPNFVACNIYSLLNNGDPETWDNETDRTYY